MIHSLEKTEFCACTQSTHKHNMQSSTTAHVARGAMEGAPSCIHRSPAAGATSPMTCKQDWYAACQSEVMHAWIHDMHSKLCSCDPWLGCSTPALLSVMLHHTIFIQPPSHAASLQPRTLWWRRTNHPHMAGLHKRRSLRLRWPFLLRLCQWQLFRGRCHILFLVRAIMKAILLVP